MIPRLSLFRRERLLQSISDDASTLGERLAARARRDRRIVAAVAATVGVVLIGFLGYALRLSYEHVWDAARARTAGLARVLDEETKRSVQAVDLSLVNLAGYLRRHPETAPYDGVFADMMAAQLRNLPYVRALFVVGPDGLITQDTDQGTPHVSLADRDYFRQAVAHPTEELFVGQPLKSRSTQIGSPWFLSLSRPLVASDGAFRGVIVAALEPHYFERFYDELRADREMSIALAHRDGFIVARYPIKENAVGGQIAEPLRHLLAEHSSGGFTSRSIVDGLTRLFSYRIVDPYPLVVMVGVGRDALVSAWWRERRVELVPAALALLVLGVAAVTIRRELARDAIRDARLYRFEKSELIARMTGSIAHDFNNILAAAYGNVELLSRRLSDTDGRRELTTRALEALQRGSSLVSQILAYSRQGAAQTAPVNISTVIAEIDWMIRHAAAPATIVFHCAQDIGACNLNRSEFERALMNLCCNARDAMAEGGTITIETCNVGPAQLGPPDWPDVPSGEYVACRVRDEGEGMPPHVIAQACDPYFTTKPVGRGTGLGLSQVADFARQCGGRLQIKSAVGVGT